MTYKKEKTCRPLKQSQNLQIIVDFYLKITLITVLHKK
jgi:hypothetical protein